MPARYCCLIHWKVHSKATDEWHMLYVVHRYHQFNQKFILTNEQKSSKNASCTICNCMSLLSLFPSHTYHTHSLRQIQLLMKKYFLVQSIQPLLQICIQQSTSKLPKVKFPNCMHTFFLCHTLVPDTSKFESFLSEVFWVPPPSYTGLLNCFGLKSAFFFDKSYQAAAVIIFFFKKEYFPQRFRKIFSQACATKPTVP